MFIVILPKILCITVPPDLLEPSPERVKTEKLVISSSRAESLSNINEPSERIRKMLQTVDHKLDRIHCEVKYLGEYFTLIHYYVN